MIAYITWDISPEIFEGFAFLRWYGLCWVIGIFLGQRIMFSIYKKEGLPVAEVDELSIYMMFGGIIGARFGHILFYDPVYYLNNPIEILPVKIHPHFEFTGLAGLASHGGVLGALLALYFYNRKVRRNYLWLLDRLMIAAAALAAFIRLGNLMNSEIVGTSTNVPWAFVFTRLDQIPRHPSQLYEALFYFIVTILLFFIWRSEKFRTAQGFIFGLGMTLIFTLRFFVEFVKENQVPFEESLALNMGQMLSIPMIAGGIILMVWSARKRSATNIVDQLN